MRDPQALVSTEQLDAMRDDPRVRIFDCTTYFDPPPAGSDVPYIPVPGRQTFEEAHIPGAGFLDIQGEFSDQTTHLRFMMPDTAHLEAAFARHGIGDGTRVVLYSRGSMMWSTRFWWMLKSLGFDNAAVLDGGFDKWAAEGRVTESGPPRGYPPAVFTAQPRPGYFVDRDTVLSRLNTAGTVIVNALGPTYHEGIQPTRYGRPGRIPGSVNVPATTLVEANSSFTSAEDAAAKFASAAVSKDLDVICYCGGAISATIDLFMLYQLGYDNLSLYDGSMGEWARDPALPIETD